MFSRTWSRRLLRISAALATAALLVSATAGTAAASVGTVTVTSGPTPNPVVVGSTASYNLNVSRNFDVFSDLWTTHMFRVTGVSGTTGLSVASSPCVGITIWAAGSLNGVVIQTSLTAPATPVGTRTITLTVTEYESGSSCSGTVADTGTRTATLVVTPATQTITFAALGGKTYGDAPFAVSATASSGLPVTFGVTGHCSSVGSTVTITGVGNCSVTASQAGNGTYLAATDVTRAFAIAPAVLTVTPNHKEKTYGQVNPTFTVDFTGFVYGESYGVLSGNAATTTTATTASPAGDYPIAASPYSLSAANYTFVYGSGTLTVHPAPASVEADSLTKVQGEVNPTLTWTIDGLVNGDTAAVLTTNPSCSTTALTASPIGIYPITCSGAAAANYTFSYNGGNLTVVAGSLHHIVISPDPATIAAGATRAYTAEGFDVNGNSLGNVTASTVFTISGSGSCAGAVCSSTVAGTHTVTGTDGALTDTATLVVSAGAPNHVVISPDPRTIVAGSTQAYTVEIFDENGNSLGDATAATAFTISGSGTCAGAACGAGVAGDYTVTATTTIPDVGRWTDTAILHVTAVPATPTPTVAPTTPPTAGPTASPTVGPTEVVGGETATPSRNATPPPTSTNGSTPNDGSVPLLILLIAFAFGALGLLAVQTQRREIRR